MLQARLVSSLFIDAERLNNVHVWVQHTYDDLAQCATFISRN